MKKYIFLILASIPTAAMAQQQKITILQTADIHAYLNPHDELFVENGQISFRKTGGLAHIKTLVNQIKKENPKGTLLIDGGDFYQGSGESFRSQGAIFPNIIHKMDYDLIIPGNWEVIYGKEVMMKLMNNYKTNVISSNMFHSNDNKSLFPQYWITEMKGVKIGFISYNDPEIPIRQNPEYSDGIAFTVVNHNLKTLVSKMKSVHKVDLLFIVAHIGISKQIALANHADVEGVDFIFGNDTHERIRKPIEGKYAKVVEPGAFGSFLGRLDITVENGKMIDYQYNLIEVDPKKYPADRKVQKIIDQQLKPFAQEMNEVLGYTTTPLYRYLVVENPMDNLITDALLWKTGADFATSNGFRFGVPILPNENGIKAITKRDLWRMLPVDEHMKIGEVSGEQILNWLEKEINNVYAKDPSKRFGGWLVRFSGMTLKFDSSKEMGERVLEVTIQGKPLEKNKMYKMASCNRTGEPLATLCRMPNAKYAEIQKYTLHNAVKDYLKHYGTVSPKLDGRAQAVDQKPNAFSKIDEVGYEFK